MLRTAQRINRHRQATAKSRTIPAPVGGWNARDALADMPEIDAVRLENWFPGTSGVKLRDGDTQHATGLDDQVESLMVYSNATTSKLFAASGAEIHDVTAAGAVGAAVVSALTNARWQYINFRTAAGAYLLAVNGADEPRRYDGTVWTATHGITGPTTTTLIGIAVWKSRIWFIPVNSMSAWYLASLAISGAATEFPFGSVFRRGGYLVAIASVTHDSGSGLDDFFVAVSSEGEMVVYQGTDPSAAATFALVGLFEIGKPIGRRCFVQYGGDLLYLSRDGFHSVAGLVKSGRASNSSMIADKIRNAVTEATGIGAAFFGWEAIVYAEKNALICNVPIATGVWHQYVMNTITGAWCKFTGWSANCFAVFNGNLYYGWNLATKQAWTGRSDGGADIVGDAKTAFSDFGFPVKTKHFMLGNPNLIVSGSIALTFGMNFDFADITPQGLIGVSGPAAAVWDVSAWDDAVWGGTMVNNSWHTIGGEGSNAATVLIVRTHTVSVEWTQTEYVFGVGSIVG